jgi:hypothetical protein
VTQSGQFRNLHDLFERLADLCKGITTRKQKDNPNPRKYEKKRLNITQIGNSCCKAKKTQPSEGLESWSRELLQKTNTSQEEDDAILLIKTFKDDLPGWMLMAVPEVDYWVTRPKKYREILLYILKNSKPDRPDMAVQARREVAPAMATMPASQLQHSHAIIAAEATDSPSDAPEQHTEGTPAFDRQSSIPLSTPPNGMIQPSDSLVACERQADERSDVDTHTQVASRPLQRNVKRPNDEESPERKRMRLEFRQADPHGANETMLAEHAISTLISVPDQEPCMPTSPEQSAGVETPAPTGRCSTIHSLMSVPQAPTIEDVSPNFEYLVQTGSAGPMRSDGSALDRHTSTHEYNVYHVREDNLTQTSGILDDSNPWSDPNYTHDEPDIRWLSDLKFLNEEKLDDGTGDSIVTYRWGGLCALLHCGEDKQSVSDARWFYLNMKLCQLPFDTLAETVKKSKRWENENIKESTLTSCLTIRLQRGKIDSYCYLDCIVPTDMVPQVREIQRRNDHAQ